MWRLLAIGLAAANVLFFAWTQWAAPQTRPAAMPAPPVVAAPRPMAEPEPRCVRLGPFTDPAAAATLSQRLVAASMAPQLREEVLQQREGWWVFVTAPGVAEQRALLARLRAAGIQDAYALADDADHRVSLGIFSERSRAEQRATTLKPLGLAPRVEDHLQPRPVQWLDVPGAGDRLSASRLEGFGITDSEIGAFDCP